MADVLKEEAERYLGAKIPEQLWRPALTRSKLKLERIIKREGDAGGERREPWYLAQLIAEDLRERRLAEYTATVEEAKRNFTEWVTKKERPAPKDANRSKAYDPIVAQSF